MPAARAGSGVPGRSTDTSRARVTAAAAGATGSVHEWSVSVVYEVLGEHGDELRAWVASCTAMLREGKAADPVRLDGPGMRWDRERSELLLHLRCILVSGQWDAFRKLPRGTQWGHDERAADSLLAICNHSFRATGITLHQENGGDIEAAARLAGHADTRTTQLYNRNRRSVTLVEVERVHI